MTTMNARLRENSADLVERLSMDDDIDINFDPIQIGLKVPAL